jgi:tripartite-type tricarboxylate transporter receptor subunit TctC
MRRFAVISLIAGAILSAATTAAYAAGATVNTPGANAIAGAVVANAGAGATVSVPVANAAASVAGANAADSVPGYPDHPIRLIVPFSVGGSADMYSRTIAQKLGAAFNQSVVVDNRAGAGGVIGTSVAAASPSDGYTLMIGNIGTIGINPALYRKLPYDPANSFIPVTEIASAPFVMVVVPQFPAKTVQEFIALAKSKPGVLNYASTGNGSPGHLTGSLLESLAGVKLSHVPYKNIGAILTDLISGRVQVYFIGIAPAKTQITGGQLRALATTGAHRSALMPDVPTVAESGVPGFEVSGWYGVFLPKGASPALVAQLNRVLVKITKDPEVKTRFAADGAELVGNSPEEFSAYITTEMAKWAKVVKISGAHLE